ncbi:MAG: YbaN family protein [Rikenellaceae bacterium]
MKIIFIIIGVLSLILGTLGIFIPLLPTTPFLLLSAALFVRSSPRLYSWLIKNPVLGKYIRNYRENRSVPMRVKVTSLVMLWASLLYCILAVVADRIYIQGLLLTIAILVSWHIISLGTTPRK